MGIVKVGIDWNMAVEDLVQNNGLTTEEANEAIMGGVVVSVMADTYGITQDEAIGMIIVVEAVAADVAATTGATEEQVVDVMVAGEIAKEEGKTTEQVLAEMGTMIDEAIPDTQVVSAIEKALGALLSAGDTPAPTPAPTAVKKIGEHITDMISNQLTP